MPNHIIEGDKVRFSHKGRIYSLFMRRGYWNLKIQRGGIRRQFSTKTADPGKAVELAQELIDTHLYGVAPQMIETCPLAVVIQEYRKIAKAHGLSPRTVGQNIACLKKILNISNAHKVSLLAVTDKVVRDFFDREIAKAEPGEAGRQRKLRSIKSTLTQAKSIFKGSYLARYRDAKIPINTVKSFMDESTESPVSVLHEPLTDEQIHKVEEMLSPGPLEIVYLLARATLRRSEILRFEWTWMAQQNGTTYIHMDENQKGKRKTKIPVCDTISTKLWDYAKSDMFPKDIRGSFCNILDRLMRRAGIHTQHTLHELRAYSLHKVQEKYGLEMAQMVGRHTCPQTTQRHYVGYVRVPEEFSLEKKLKNNLTA